MLLNSPLSSYDPSAVLSGLGPNEESRESFREVLGRVGVGCGLMGLRLFEGSALIITLLLAAKVAACKGEGVFIRPDTI